jgi:hypothetical protein
MQGFSLAISGVTPLGLPPVFLVNVVVSDGSAPWTDDGATPTTAL